jgi:hypothetical protein
LSEYPLHTGRCFRAAELIEIVARAIDFRLCTGTFYWKSCLRLLENLQHRILHIAPSLPQRHTTMDTALVVHPAAVPRTITKTGNFKAAEDRRSKQYRCPWWFLEYDDALGIIFVEISSPEQTRDPNTGVQLIKKCGATLCRRLHMWPILATYVTGRYNVAPEIVKKIWIGPDFVSSGPNFSTGAVFFRTRWTFKYVQHGETLHLPPPVRMLWLTASLKIDLKSHVEHASSFTRILST